MEYYFDCCDLKKMKDRHSEDKGNLLTYITQCNGTSDLSGSARSVIAEFSHSIASAVYTDVGEQYDLSKIETISEAILRTFATEPITSSGNMHLWLSLCPAAVDILKGDDVQAQVMLGLVFSQICSRIIPKGAKFPGWLRAIVELIPDTIEIGKVNVEYRDRMFALRSRVKRFMDRLVHRSGRQWSDSDDEDAERIMIMLARTCISTEDHLKRVVNAWAEEVGIEQRHGDPITIYATLV